MSGGIDWAQLLTHGLVRLGLKPSDFWALTPVELMLMLGVGGAAPGLTKESLMRLADAYPDKKVESDDKFSRD